MFGFQVFGCLRSAFVNMALGRVVPWASWEEWGQVRVGLLSADPSMRRAALDRVKAWEARGRLPLGAEITAYLHELHMRDQGYGATVAASSQPTSEPESLLRLQYAMLVIRLVNGVSDSSQKGRVAMSVANLAEDAGIPRILVDVRHDASHNELPSLALLRLASSAALSWLSSSYWQRQADHLLSCRAHISSLLQRYIELQRAALLKQASTGKAEEEDSLAEAAADVQAQAETYRGAVGQKQRREVMAEMWERVHAAADLLIGPLLDDGLLEVQQEASNGGKMGSEQVAAAVWEAVMQGLAGTWPQLKQLLLAAAIQRLCSTVSPSSINANAGEPEKDGKGVVSRADALTEWAGRLLGMDGQKKSRQQKTGVKRKSSQADLDMAGLREQWRPSAPQLHSLLASCLSALAQNGGGAEDVHQRAALRRVAGMLLQQLQSVEEEGSHVHAGQLQRLLEVSTANLLEAGTASGHNMQELSEALLSASAKQEDLMQSAIAAAAGAKQESARKARWCLAKDWAPCALGMLPCPHHLGGRMPSLDIATCPHPMVLADAQTTDPVTVALQQPAANAMSPDVGTGSAPMDSKVAEVEQGAALPDHLEVQDYFSKFNAKSGEGASDTEVKLDDGWTSDQIQRIAAAVKVL